MTIPIEKLVKKFAASGVNGWRSSMSSSTGIHNRSSTNIVGASVLKLPTASRARYAPAPTPATPHCAFLSLGWRFCCRMSGCCCATCAITALVAEGTSSPLACCAFTFTVFCSSVPLSVSFHLRSTPRFLLYFTRRYFRD